MTDEAADECAGGGREMRDDALLQTLNSTITPTGAAATRAFVAFVNVTAHSLCLRRARRGVWNLIQLVRQI